MGPKIAVIILTLNSERHIARCLQSLARQTYRDFEALVVDAGSHDGTQKIVSRFDERFRWLELPGSDMGAARNHGIRASRAEYVTFLDSDDFYLRDKLEVQAVELDGKDAVDVTFCQTLQYRTNNILQLATMRRHGESVYSFNEFLMGQCYNVNTIFMRRSLCERGLVFGEGTRGRYGEEWRLQLHMSLSGVAMSFIPRPLVVVEMRPDSHTNSSLQWRMKLSAIDEVERAVGSLPASVGPRPDVRKIFGRYRIKLIFAYLLDGRKREALSAVAKLEPSWMKIPWGIFISCLWVFPSRWVAAATGKFWILRQNSLYDWNSDFDSDAKFQIRELIGVSPHLPG